MTSEGEPPQQHTGRQPERWLTDPGTPELSGDVFDLDEELARATDQGRISHAVIARLAADTRSPSIATVQALVDDQLSGFAPIEARAHRQNIRGVVHRYFTQCLPPSSFIFGGANFNLGVGRPDLVWFDFDEHVLADEVKTGSPRTLRLARTREQVERYRSACVDTWGDRFLGIRLLCPVDPAASLLITPDGASVALATTPYLQRI